MTLSSRSNWWRCCWSTATLKKPLGGRWDITFPGTDSPLWFGRPSGVYHPSNSESAKTFGNAVEPPKSTGEKWWSLEFHFEQVLPIFCEPSTLNWKLYGCGRAFAHICWHCYATGAMRDNVNSCILYTCRLWFKNLCSMRVILYSGRFCYVTATVKPLYDLENMARIVS